MAMTRYPRSRYAVLLAAFVAYLAAAPSAHALVVRNPDGTYSDGCGLAQVLNPHRPARLAVRPSLPSSYVSASGHFRIHYTANPSSPDHVPLLDADGDGVPDWVEVAAQIADSVLDRYRALGYNVATGDGGAGGGPEYDIYMTDLAPQGVYGYTYPPPDPYMQIDNDFANNIYETKGYNALRVTLAHELFHSVQFLYYVGGADASWWQEMTAVFMEDINYPNINDYVQYLNPSYFDNTIFSDPGIPLNSASGAHMYGAAVFCHFLNQSDPADGQRAIRTTFERMHDTNSADPSVIIGAIQDVMGQPIGDLLATFWAWSYFTGSRTRPGMFFQDAALYTSPPPSALTPSQWVVQDLSAAKTARADVQIAGLAAMMEKFVPDGSGGGLKIDFAASGPGGDKWGWRVAVATPDTVRILTPMNGEISVANWNNATDVVLTAANGNTDSIDRSASWNAAYDKSLVIQPPPPVVLRLMQNYPNPFNPATSLPFNISENASVTAIVYDLLGRPVRTLLSNQPLDAGQHEVSWDGTTSLGRPAGTGLYVVRVVAGDASSSKRMVLAR